MYAQAMDEEARALRAEPLMASPCPDDGSSSPARQDGAADPGEPGEEEAAGLLGHLQAVAEPVAGAIGSVLEAATAAISGQNAQERRLHRLNREPLANLYELYPEARDASPRELGLRFVPVEEIRGTAVAGGAQRGGDFLPLPPFRGENWESRWNRIRHANERLETLPPVDLVKYDDGYWVLDGHNRVAAALYADGAGLDAMVTELVPLDGRTSERPTGLAGLLTEAGELRAAAAGHRPAFAMRQGDQFGTSETPSAGWIEPVEKPRDGGQRP